jgi:biotin carboxyl carrier protein
MHLERGEAVVDVRVAGEEVESDSGAAGGKDVVGGRDHRDAVDEPREDVAEDRRLDDVAVLHAVRGADQLLERRESCVPSASARRRRSRSELEFRLPQLVGDETEAEILAWTVADGDAVTEGQVILEVTFEKASVEIPAPASGTISGITSGPGDIVVVGDVLAAID